MLASFIWEKTISTDSFLIPTFCRPYLSVKTSEKLTYLTESYIPRWLCDKESVCHCRRLRFKPWVKESPLEEEMATHSSLENPMDKGAWRATVHGITRRHDWATEYTHTHTHTLTHTESYNDSYSCFREGNGNPCSAVLWWNNYFLAFENVGYWWILLAIDKIWNCEWGCYKNKVRLFKIQF